MALVIFGISACATFAPHVDPPYVNLSDISVGNIGLFEQRYVVQLRVQNPNAFELPITGLDLKVSFGNLEFGRGVSRQAVTVPAYGESLIDVDVVSDLFRFADQLRDLELGKGEPLRYRVQGGMSIKNRMSKVPFDFHGEFGGAERLPSP